MKKNIILTLRKQFSFETQNKASDVYENRLNCFSDLENSQPRKTVNIIGMKTYFLLKTQLITNYQICYFTRSPDDYSRLDIQMVKYK